MEACKMDGNEKILLFVIGKLTKTTLSVDCVFSKKVWMNSEIFIKWLTNVYLKFHHEKKIVKFWTTVRLKW